MDFFDRLKSVSRGFASLDYNFVRFEKAPLVKIDLLINGDRVDALALIIHRDNAQAKGRQLTDKMKDLIPRQQFDRRGSGGHWWAHYFPLYGESAEVKMSWPNATVAT